MKFNFTVEYNTALDPCEFRDQPTQQLYERELLERFGLTRQQASPIYRTWFHHYYIKRQ